LCSLYEKGQGFAPPSGSGRLGVLVVAEALGAKEAQLGEALVGDAGFQWKRILERTRLSTDDFRKMNAVNCRPPNNWLEGAPWEMDAISHCDHFLLEEVARMKPAVIMPLGNIAMRSVLGRRGIEKLRGYVYDTRVAGHDCRVVPTYHPSFILRGKDNLTGVSIFDIQRAVRVAREGWEDVSQRYIERPTDADFQTFLREAQSAAAAGVPLSADIETPKSAKLDEDEYGDIIDAEIISIAFAFRAHTGITLSWTNSHFPFIEAILSLPWSHVLFWNANFDVPRIQSKGLTIEGKILDTLELWRWCQSDVPHGLGFASTFFTRMREWKSLSDQQPDFYACCDVDAQLQCYAGIKRVLEKEQRFAPFVKHVVELTPLLKDMAHTGLLVDKEKRAEFRSVMQAEYDEMHAELQELVPPSLRKIKYRARWPEDVEIGTKVRPNSADKAYWYIDGNGEWVERFDFLATSSRQVIAYIRSQRHPVPKDHKTEEDTTEVDELEKLSKRYPKDKVYPQIIKIRQHKKLLGQYLGDTKSSYAPDEDGRVRTNFGFKTSTGRLNSWNPNMMNVIKRSDLATLYRKQFIPAPGHVFLEVDYTSGEPTLVGYFAEDDDYVNFARMGIHAIFGLYVQNGKLNLADLLPQHIAAFKKSHKELYNRCKRVVNGSNNGETPFKMHMDFPEEFPRRKDAEELQKLYFTTLGRKIKAWHLKILDEAGRKCFLQNPFGGRHYFYEIVRWDSRKRQYVPGSSANRALAFMQQSTLRYVLTAAVQRIAKENPAIFRMMRLLIHDAVLMEVPESRLAEVAQLVIAEFTKAVPELGDLSIGAEAEWSAESWGDMEPLDLD